MMRFIGKYLILLAASSLLLQSCNYLPDWIGKEDEEVLLPGERIALKRKAEHYESEILGGENQLLLPPAQVNEEWRQPLGSAAGVSDHLTLAPAPALYASAEIGDGASFQSSIVPSPILYDGHIFAMDGDGTISAHDAISLSALWKSDALNRQETSDSLLGGGIAAGNETIFATNDEGYIAALSAKSGELLWRKQLSLPIRSAPCILGDTVLVLSADNNLLALNMGDGEIRWRHQGLNDQASQLQATTPAAGGNTVLATYSSGEVTALDLENGAVLWSDMLAGSAQTALKEDRFGYLSALMTPRVSFAGSSLSFTAYTTQKGRRVWERRLPLLQAPWLVGTTLFVLNKDLQLMAINGSNGRIFWVQELLGTEDDDRILWQHPIVASGIVWIIGSHGKMYGFNAINGNPLITKEIPDEVAAAPMVANKTLYVVDRDAQLHAFK